MSINVKITNNSKEVLAELEKNIQLGLNAIGNKAERYAKDNCPVDTGRLRNSINYATATAKGSGKDTKSGDSVPKSTPEKEAVYIGTNVEYAPSVEYKDMKHTTGEAHFLKNAASNHSEEYKKTMEAALKE